MTQKKTTINSVEILKKLPWEENQDLEFKSAKGGLPDDVWPTYSAMANTSGGVILIGVEDNGSIIGIPNIAKIKKNFWSLVNNRGKISANILTDDDVKEIDYPKGKVLAIRIRQANRREKPIYVGLNPLRGTYRRNFEGDYHCTEQEVKRMLADQAEEPADSLILEKYTINDLDLPSIQQYRQRLSSRNPDHPWLQEDDKGLLCKLNGWRRCRASHIEGVTVAGLLMFGKEEAIREALPQYNLDYREKLSIDPEIRWTDRLTLDGTWPGNLYQFYTRVNQRLSADVKLPFQLDDKLIRKGETSVHVAIREALVNSLIHADYHGQGGVIVEKYKDRFEFSNPGSLLISFDQLLEGGVSECRNKSLQVMFTLIGAAEKAGSGVDKIIKGWRSQHWRSPLVKETTQPTRVIWILPMISLIPEESLQRLKNQFDTQFSKLNSLEVQALVTADIEKYVDNVRMRQITHEHAADITKILQSLVSKGFLEQDGQGRWTQYYLPLANNSIPNESQSLPNEIHSLPKESQSLPNETHSLPKESQSLYKEKISEAEWNKLKEIASQANLNKRLNRKKMETIILNICKEHWLTRNQISELVNRNSESLRTRYLTSLVEQNLIRLRYPEKPNRVDQAYKKVD